MAIATSCLRLGEPEASPPVRGRHGSLCLRLDTHGGGVTAYPKVTEIKYLASLLRSTGRVSCPRHRANATSASSRLFFQDAIRTLERPWSRDGSRNASRMLSRD